MDNKSIIKIADPNLKGVHLIEIGELRWDETMNYTPLMWASEGGHIEVVRDLLNADAEIDVQDGKGRTALIDAAWSGHEEVVDALAEAGANLNLLTTFEGATALVGAIVNGEIGIALSLLDANADPNTQGEFGFTALMTASSDGEKEMVRALLEADANPNLRDDEGKTALMWVSKEGHTEIVEMLEGYS